MLRVDSSKLSPLFLQPPMAAEPQLQHMASHGTSVISHMWVAVICHQPPSPSRAALGISPALLPLIQACDTSSSSSYFVGRQVAEGCDGSTRSHMGCGYVWVWWHSGSSRVAMVSRSQPPLFTACQLWHHTGALPAQCQPCAATTPPALHHTHPWGKLSPPRCAITS